MAMTENQKKFWKLALIAVPVIVSNIGSYAKSRAESKDESKASYEALSKAFAELKKNADEDHDHIAAVEGQVEALKDLITKLETTRSSRMRARPSADAGVDGDGIPDSPKPFAYREPSQGAALPEKFEDVVQQYKAKK